MIPSSATTITLTNVSAAEIRCDGDATRRVLAHRLEFRSGRPWKRARLRQRRKIEYPRPAPARLASAAAATLSRQCSYRALQIHQNSYP